jgi:hypothetical protein
VEVDPDVVSSYRGLLLFARLLWKTRVFTSLGLPGSGGPAPSSHQLWHVPVLGAMASTVSDVLKVHAARDTESFVCIVAEGPALVLQNPAEPALLVPEV